MPPDVGCVRKVTGSWGHGTPEQIHLLVSSVADRAVGRGGLIGGASPEV